MEKFLLVLVLILGCFILVGCNEDTQYQKAEQICRENDGTITKVKEGGYSCLRDNGMWCPLSAIEEGDCFVLDYGGDLPLSEACKQEGGSPEIWLEGGEEQEVCFFDDESFCYMDDFANFECKKGDMKYYDEENEDIQEGGEWITVVSDMCEEKGGSIEELYEWTDKQNVCYFSDDSFCYLDDFVADSCHKGDNKRKEPNYGYPQDLNGKSMEEAFCLHNDGIIITNEYGDNFCVFEDGGYYELKAFKELGEMPALRGQDEPFCSVYENVVCGIDGVSYVNECWMKDKGVEKDLSAEFIDGNCIKK